MRLRSLVAGTTAAAAIVLTGGTAALADGIHQLHPIVYGSDLKKDTDGGFAKWVTFAKNGDDSPLDANARALVVHDDAADYDAEVTTHASLNINKPASAISNLSFDAYKPALQGGSPRINVVFQNTLSDGSSYVAIDAGNCQQTLSSTWVRADATGYTGSGCTIYSSLGTPYSSGGGHSAWDSFVAANPDAVVAYTYMVFDEPSSNTGIDYRVDRIALGTGKMYTSGNSPVTCRSESAC